ncbi:MULTISPECIES: cation diffusion facilitator family transporter [unclassified Methylobacterium]|uniref:cation diffusion facilitator family transporter n=1 Tax=unclassified Methylobacterium TaxID=2615210 RepID=UPI0011C20135|nr:MULTISPECIES: cation diffusion facilitator family transporter [unclassified Methylobacterium]QEE42041.1 cation transporter [Methylobacterium sp. WL1]TXM99319.1 cation transporter [Methylobacterium sp. WL64]TXN54033.1 cation transporter [Methylobacterium sp. WL2]
MAHESTGAIYAAAGANLAIAAAKFVGGALTGSTAMLAEGVHSVVDTANQVLLLVGMKRAKRPADARHPFGYGREIYFYAFVVALMIFLGGGVFAVYEGVERIRHPSPDADAHLFGYTLPGIWVNVAILGFAIVAEGISWFVAMRQFWAEKGKHSAMRAIRRSKDPTLFTILAEDTAALIGLLIALAGVVLAHWLDRPSLDGWASVGIGLVLVGMAVFLMIETHGLLIGEAADPAVVAAISDLVRAEPGVLHLNEVLTQHLGPTDILVNVSIDMADDLSAGEVEGLVTRLDKALKQRNPQVTRVFIEIQPQADHAVRAAA